MTKKTTWIDLTDFTIWRGSHTGTQRVVYQITRYIKDNENVRFCSFNYLTQVYSEVSFDVVFKKDSSISTSTKSNKFEGKVTLKKAYSLFAPPIASRVIEKIRDKQKLAHKGNKQDLRIEAGFNKSDTLLVLGGNWDKPGFIDALEAVNKQNIAIVHNINDLIPIFDKGHVSSDEHVRYEQYMKRAIKLSSKLIAISEYTKKDIQKYCKLKNIKCPKVYVIRLGDNPVGGDSKKPVQAPENYILSVSTIEVRKNHALLYYAYKEANKQGIVLPKLVLAGRRGWLTGDLQYMLTHDPEIKGKIEIIEGPSDQELAWLYENCLFTVYPSFYEGWGLPVAESIQYGKACLATSSTSVPEIAGELIDYFSPFDPLGCLRGITTLLEKKYRLSQEKNLKKGYRLTSWEDTANELVKKLLI